MSKYLVVLYNGTNERIGFVNKEASGDGQFMELGSLFTTKVHFNVPDNSDSARYFDDHHMEVQREDGTPIFSFWDDDHNDYVMMYCPGTDWRRQAMMPGTAPAGNRTNVGIILTGTFPTYEIKSCSVLYGV